ncbi:polyphenol oxidase [Musa troglodytarum]|uniref:Polyphenol oxidase n=1 Tax=Musa troglodytarum TaxID=320322 RepID=A0A9E7H274_9LILI|nr:polyphenol oxidase [Musa troglodytarum]
MSLLLNSSFTGASSACLLHRERSRRRRLRVPGVTCRQGSNDDRSDAARQKQSPLLLDRRDILLGGLGGLYGVTAGPKVLAAPKTAETKSKATTELSLTRVGEFGTTAQALDASNPLRVIVARPKKNRKKKEKQEKVEVIQIKDIKVTTNETARFDVYVAVPYGDLAGPDYGEFAGSFMRLAHRKKEQGAKKKGKLKLGITALLEDIDAEDADKLVVTLVLRTGSVTVGGVSIKLLQTDTPAVI